MKKLRGFTLLEIMIVVAIGSILAAVAINAYRKYIMKSKIAEGQIMLRKIVDAEIAFASNPAYVMQSGQVCEFYTRFSEVSMYHFDGQDGTSQYSGSPPKGIKSMTRSFFGTNPDRFHAVPNANGYCASHPLARTPITYLYNPWLLGLDQPVATILGGNHSYGLYQEPGYFLYFAGRSPEVAQETGAEAQNAFMVYGVADLDGVSLDGNYINGTYQMFQRFPYYTIMGRGIYVDAEGDPRVMPGLVMQNEEPYDQNSYYSGSSY